MNREQVRDEAAAEQAASWVTDKQWMWFWGAVIGASLPMLIPQLLGMWSHEHYRYIPFVFLVVGYLVWVRSDRMLYAPAGWLGWTMVGFGLLCVALSIVLPSTWIGGLAFVVLVATCVASMRDTEGAPLVLEAVPLLMLIQLPIGLDRSLITNLQRITTELSSVVMDMLGVPHSISGNAIQLVSRELFIAEQCSGIQSVFTMAFIASVIIAIYRRQLWLTPIYLAIACFLALTGNTIRVTTVAVAEHWFAKDLSTGWQHDVLGYVTLGIAAAFLLSFDQLIITLLHPASTGNDGAKDSPLIRGWNFLVAGTVLMPGDSVYGENAHETFALDQRLKPSLLDRLILNRTAWYTVASLLGIVGLSAAIQATRVEINQAPRQLLGSIVLFNPSAELFNGDYQITTVGEHNRTRNGTDETLGENADIWECEVAGIPGMAVISQSYRGWHELCVCYEVAGWTQLSRDVTDPPETENPPENPQSFITARFKNEHGHFGYLLYSAVSEKGNVPAAPDSFGAFGARFVSRLERYGVLTQENLVMFQLWMVTSEKISSETLRQAQVDFIAMRDQITKQIVADPNEETQIMSFSESVKD